MTLSLSAIPAQRRQSLLVGAISGMLCGFLLHALGFWFIAGVRDSVVAIVVTSIVGILMGVWGRSSWITLVDGVLVVLCAAIIFTPVIHVAAGAWVRQDAFPLTGSVDAVVVLSSGVTTESTLTADGADRLLAGLELLRAGRASRLVTTHLTAEVAGRLVDSNADQQRLASIAGVARGWIVLDGVHTTRQEAVRAAAVLPAYGAHTIAVVTSPMHTRRACAAFETLGFHVTCVPARERTAIAWHPVRPDDRLAAFRQYAYERLAMVRYRGAGWAR